MTDLIKPPSSAKLLREYKTHILVWRDGDRVFKQQPKYNTDTEYYFLKLMESSGYTPKDVKQEDIETVSMQYIQPQKVVNPLVFMAHYEWVLGALALRNIRHGDLTIYSVIVHKDKPYIIDFGESRWIQDPIPPKRPEPDSTLLWEAMKQHAQNRK